MSGTIALLVTIAGITAPIALYFLVQWTGVGKFLFERPDWARIDGRYRQPRAALVPAEYHSRRQRRRERFFSPRTGPLLRIEDRARIAG